LINLLPAWSECARPIRRRGIQCGAICIVPLALGTDTAGSGRVPAMLNKNPLNSSCEINPFGVKTAGEIGIVGLTSRCRSRGKCDN